MTILAGERRIGEAESSFNVGESGELDAALILKVFVCDAGVRVSIEGRRWGGVVVELLVVVAESESELVSVMMMSREKVIDEKR